MTNLQVVYDAFLVKVLEDEWANWDECEVRQDLLGILKAALPRFKFPRVDLTLNNFETAFNGDLSNNEVQIVATYMKCEWLNRSIDTWERIKPLYEERDFSEANMLDKLYDALEIEQKQALKLESIYYRSINFKPWNYKSLAGDQNG